MITITARNILKPGKKDEFLEAIRPLVEASRAEEGNISYDLYEDIECGDAVCFIETWRDAAAIEAHNGSPHFREWMERKGTLVASGEVNKYRRRD